MTTPSNNETAISARIADGVATVILNRPDKLNAFTADMLVAFREALESAARDDAVRAVLLTGAGRGFCG